MYPFIKKYDMMKVLTNQKLRYAKRMIARYLGQKIAKTTGAKITVQLIVAGRISNNLLYFQVVIEEGVRIK